MNYKNLYDKIINKAKSENRAKTNDIYYEKHHILPKSIGGDNSQENTVLLTAKEHFVCHHLLTKFSYGKDKYKMNYAFWGMCNQLKGDVQRYYKVSSKLYAVHRNIIRATVSKQHKGKKLSQAHIKIIRGRMLSNKNPMKGKLGLLNPLFKKSRPDFIKIKISETKLKYPERNGNFKGYYKTPYGKFTSAKQASNTLGIHPTTILKWCKRNLDKVCLQSVNGSNGLLALTDVGKTYNELGWYFLHS